MKTLKTDFMNWNDADADLREIVTTMGPGVEATAAHMKVVGAGIVPNEMNGASGATAQIHIVVVTALVPEEVAMNQKMMTIAIEAGAEAEVPL